VEPPVPAHSLIRSLPGRAGPEGHGLRRGRRGEDAAPDAAVPDGPSDAARDEARLGLYVHVPFCATRCTYCDFASGKLSPVSIERWQQGMVREAGMRAPLAAGRTFTSVFFGGGTPSALPPAVALEVMAALRGCFTIAPSAEVTLEANPESVDDRRLEAWRAMGVNRLSFGAQSFDAGELQGLGRVHDAGAPARAVERARGHGFERLSIDLMFGFPGHGEASWVRSIESALALGVEHLSAYAFIPEGGTPLGNAVLREEAHELADDSEADLYALLEARVAAAGFAPYETSNFCRPGAEARHNLTYWLRRPYVALGPSAHGSIGGERYANHYALERWATALERGERPEASRETESPEAVAQEILLLGLRLARGIEAGDHDPAVWSAFRSRYAVALEAAERAGRVERTLSGWRIPRHLRFVADDAIAWIEARAEGRAGTAPARVTT
jgi:oxygen-independent coproporphyrinogen-3 oxidase